MKINIKKEHLSSKLCFEDWCSANFHYEERSEMPTTSLERMIENRKFREDLCYCFTYRPAFWQIPIAY